MNRFPLSKAIATTLSAVLIGGLLAMFVQPAVAAPPEAGRLVYFGTYTGKKSKGIYVSRLDGANGKLTAPELAAETTSPSFLAVDPRAGFSTR